MQFLKSAVIMEYAIMTQNFTGLTLSIRLLADADWMVNYADRPELTEKICFSTQGIIVPEKPWLASWRLNAGNLEIFDTNGDLKFISDCAQIVGGLVHIFFHTELKTDTEIFLIEALCPLYQVDYDLD